jgi:hypothetical protein
MYHKYMNKRKIALIYRCLSAVLVLFGILWFALGTESVFEPDGWHSLLYYTILSNILVFGVFIALIIQTSRSIIGRTAKSEKRGLLPVVEAGAVVCIMLTFLVFWALLAPGYFKDGANGWPSLLTWHNLSVHVLAPILMAADYFVFCERGKLRRNDIWWYLIFPLGYVLYATVAGLLGATYESGRRFPYGFMDYDKQGWGVILWFVGLSALFVGMSLLVYWTDKKLVAKKDKV